MITLDSLAIKCPSCDKSSLHIQNNFISCNSCEYKLEYLCLHCNKGTLNHNGEYLTCNHCKKKSYLDTIKYILNNKLSLDYNTTCERCESPTLHRSDINFVHTCMHFPKCSDKNMLFQEKRTYIFRF